MQIYYENHGINVDTSTIKLVYDGKNMCDYQYCKHNIITTNDPEYMPYYNEYTKIYKENKLLKGWRIKNALCIINKLN